MIEFHELAGWSGAVLLLSGFIWGLCQAKANQRTTYLLINIIGALGIIINTYSTGAYPAMSFNIIWMLVALFTWLKKLIKE